MGGLEEWCSPGGDAGWAAMGVLDSTFTSGQFLADFYEQMLNEKGNPQLKIA